MQFSPEFEPVSTAGMLDAVGDADVFRLALLPGRQYQITVTGSVGLEVFTGTSETGRTAAENAFLATQPQPNGSSVTFVAQPGEIYFADVQSLINTFTFPRPYEIEVIETFDDALAGPQTAARVALGHAFDGIFEAFGDQDWVQLDVSGGENYLVTTQVAILDSLVVVGFDAQSGERVDLPFEGVRTASANSTQVGFSARDGVNYYAVLQDVPGGGNPDYTVSLSTLSDGEASDSTTRASVDPGGTYQGSINVRGDYDWVRLNTIAGESYQPSLRFTGPTNRFSLIEIDDATAEIIGVVDAALVGSGFSARAGSSYFIAITPGVGFGENGDYELILTQYDDDFADNSSTTGVLRPDESIGIDRELNVEFDFIRLDVEAGQSYVVGSTNSSFDVVRSDQLDLWPNTPLFDFSDPRVDFSGVSPGEDGPRAHLDAEAGFEYFVVVAGSGGFFGTSISLDEANTSDTPDNASTTVSVGANQEISGVFEIGSDQDWMRLDVAAGDSVVVTVSGNIDVVNTPRDALHLFAVGADGSVELLSRQNFQGGQTVVTGRADETLYLQVGGVEGFLGGRQVVPGSTYTVGLTPLDDVVAADPATAPVLGTSPSVLNLIGTPNADFLNGSDTDELINAGDGGDWITPGAGSDTVDGGDGRDMLNFGSVADTPGRTNVQYRLDLDLTRGTATTSGDDVYTITNIERVTGSIFADRIKGDAGDNDIRGLGDFDWLIASEGSDNYDGGTGRDMVSYLDAVAGVTVNLGDSSANTGLAAGDTYASVERITGSVHIDVFFGDEGENDFRGLGGFDVFYSSTGGRERYDGGNGSDTVTYVNATAGVIADLSRGFGSGGDARLDLYTSIENLGGTAFDDVLTGEGDRNNLRGLSGDDIIFGGGGIDRISGGRGDDTIDGGDGSDYILYRGDSSYFDITRDGNTRNAIVSWAGPGAGDGTDTLTNVEYFVFDDTTIDIWSL